MKADAHPLKTLFSKDIRYVVPLYQRPYVWTREDKLEPLWEDVMVLTRAVQADGTADPHFLGAIVLDYQFGPTSDLEMRHIIDGQQRLVTLQVLLRTASRIAALRGCEKQARLLLGLTANNPDLYVDPDHQFKVWPTNIAYFGGNRPPISAESDQLFRMKAISRFGVSDQPFRGFRPGRWWRARRAAA